MEFKGLKNECLLLEESVIERIRQIIRKGDFIMGSEVQELEEVLSAYIGTRFCISCGNGTDGLILALMAEGVSQGDVVIVPDFSFIATASSVLLLGGVPAFVDIDPDTYTISPDSIEKAIYQLADQGIQCKGIIAVDLFGLPADYTRIREIADQNNLFLIEDAAQGFGQHH